MNCYVLYCLATKVEQLCDIFNGINDIHAYIPKIEEHVRYQEEYIVNGKAIITKGPLKAFEDNIVNLDKRNRLAYLDIKFLDRNIKAGLWIKQNTVM